MIGAIVSICLGFPVGISIVLTMIYGFRRGRSLVTGEPFNPSGLYNEHEHITNMAMGFYHELISRPVKNIYKAIVWSVREWTFWRYMPSVLASYFGYQFCRDMITMIWSFDNPDMDTKSVAYCICRLVVTMFVVYHATVTFNRNYRREVKYSSILNDYALKGSFLFLAILASYGIYVTFAKPKDSFTTTGYTKFKILRIFWLGLAAFMLKIYNDDPVALEHAIKSLTFSQNLVRVADMIVDSLDSVFTIFGDESSPGSKSTYSNSSYFTTFCSTCEESGLPVDYCTSLTKPKPDKRSAVAPNYGESKRVLNKSCFICTVKTDCAICPTCSENLRLQNEAGLHPFPKRCRICGCEKPEGGRPICASCASSSRDSHADRMNFKKCAGYMKTCPEWVVDEIGDLCQQCLHDKMENDSKTKRRPPGDETFDSFLKNCKSGRLVLDVNKNMCHVTSLADGSLALMADHQATKLMVSILDSKPTVKVVHCYSFKQHADLVVNGLPRTLLSASASRYTLLPIIHLTKAFKAGDFFYGFIDRKTIKNPADHPYDLKPIVRKQNIYLNYTLGGAFSIWNPIPCGKHMHDSSTACVYSPKCQDCYDPQRDSLAERTLAGYNRFSPDWTVRNITIAVGAVTTLCIVGFIATQVTTKPAKVKRRFNNEKHYGPPKFTVEYSGDWEEDDDFEDGYYDRHGKYLDTAQDAIDHMNSRMTRAERNAFLNGNYENLGESHRHDLSIDGMDAFKASKAAARLYEAKMDHDMASDDMGGGETRRSAMESIRKACRSTPNLVAMMWGKKFVEKMAGSGQSVSYSGGKLSLGRGVGRTQVMSELTTDQRLAASGDFQYRPDRGWVPEQAVVPHPTDKTSTAPPQTVSSSPSLSSDVRSSFITEGLVVPDATRTPTANLKYVFSIAQCSCTTKHTRGASSKRCEQNGDCKAFSTCVYLGTQEGKVKTHYFWANRHAMYVRGTFHASWKLHTHNNLYIADVMLHEEHKDIDSVVLKATNCEFFTGLPKVQLEMEDCVGKDVLSYVHSTRNIFDERLPFLDIIVTGPVQPGRITIPKDLNVYGDGSALGGLRQIDLNTQKGDSGTGVWRGNKLLAILCGEFAPHGKSKSNLFVTNEPIRELVSRLGTSSFSTTSYVAGVTIDGDVLDEVNVSYDPLTERHLTQCRVPRFQDKDNTYYKDPTYAKFCLSNGAPESLPYDKNTINPDTLSASVNKFFTGFRNPVEPRNHYKSVTLASEMFNKLVTRKCRVLTYQQALDKLDLSKSCGYPFKRTYSCMGKLFYTNYPQADRSKLVINDEVRSQYLAYWDSLATGRPWNMFFDVCAKKNEIRPFDKKNKARVIFAENAFRKIASLQLSGDLLECIIDNGYQNLFGDSWCSLGLGMFDRNFQSWYQRMRPYSTSSMDGGGWETTIAPWERGAFTNFVVRHMCFDETNCVRWCNLRNDISYSLIIDTFGNIRRLKGEMGSGCFFTAHENTFINCIRIISAIDDQITIQSLNHLNSISHCMVLGDDCNMGIVPGVVIDYDRFLSFLYTHYCCVYETTTPGSILQCAWLSCQFTVINGEVYPLNNGDKLHHSMSFRADNLEAEKSAALGAARCSAANDIWWPHFYSYAKHLGCDVPDRHTTLEFMMGRSPLSYQHPSPDGFSKTKDYMIKWGDEYFTTFGHSGLDYSSQSCLSEQSVQKLLGGSPRQTTSLINKAWDWLNTEDNRAKKRYADFQQTLKQATSISETHMPPKGTRKSKNVRRKAVAQRIRSKVRRLAKRIVRPVRVQMRRAARRRAGGRRETVAAAYSGPRRQRNGLIGVRGGNRGTRIGSTWNPDDPLSTPASFGMVSIASNSGGSSMREPLVFRKVPEVFKRHPPKFVKKTVVTAAGPVETTLSAAGTILYDKIISPLMIPTAPDAVESTIFDRWSAAGLQIELTGQTGTDFPGGIVGAVIWDPDEDLPEDADALIRNIKSRYGAFMLKPWQRDQKITFRIPYCADRRGYVTDPSRPDGSSSDPRITAPGRLVIVTETDMAVDTTLFTLRSGFIGLTFRERKQASPGQVTDSLWQTLTWNTKVDTATWTAGTSYPIYSTYGEPDAQAGNFSTLEYQLPPSSSYNAVALRLRFPCTADQNFMVIIGCGINTSNAGEVSWDCRALSTGSSATSFNDHNRAIANGDFIGSPFYCFSDSGYFDGVFTLGQVGSSVSISPDSIQFNINEINDSSAVTRPPRRFEEKSPREPDFFKVSPPPLVIPTPKLGSLSSTPAPKMERKK